MKPILLIPLAAALLYAQDGGPLEIRGVVFEVGPNAPLVGAQVTVYQFDADRTRTVFASVTTDSAGAFRFNPARPGDYYVEANKAEYFGGGAAVLNGPLAASTGTLLTLSREHPSQEVRFALRRVGELSGKVVDENGKPVPGLVVDLIPEALGLSPALLSSALTSTHTERTGADGSFHAAKLTPGKYVVHVSSAVRIPPALSDFATADENAVDQDFDASYWPGVPDQASATILTVNPGGATDIGVLTARKGPRYRIHFLVRGCDPDDQLELPVPGATDLPPGLTQPSLPCKDLLLRGFRPGSYRFIATTKRGSAVVPVTITGRNLAVPLSLIPNAGVSGRVETVPGVPPPASGQVAFVLHTRNAPKFIRPDAKGNFVLEDMQCIPTQVQLMQLSKGYYVKEIRVDGAAVADATVSPCAGSKLEIVLDDKVATLAISATHGDRPASDSIVVFQKWPTSLIDRQAPPPTVNKSGSLQVTGLAPGEYRVMAVRVVARPDGEDSIAITSRLWDRASKITLEPGDAKSISVKLIDPFQPN